MEVMKRAILFLLLTVILLGGCARHESASNELVVMLPPWFSPDESRAPLKEVFDFFREHNPEAKLVLRFGPGKSLLLWQKILLMAKEKHLPDVLMFKTAWTRELTARSLLQPLPSPFAEHIVSSIDPRLIPQCVTGDTVWAAPYDLDVRLLHYRKDLVEEAGLPQPHAGWTYEEFISYAQALTRDLDGDGEIDVWGFAAPGARSLSTVAQLLPWAWTLGAEFHEGHICRLDQESLANALGIYRFLRDSVCVAPPDLHMLEQADVFQGLVSGRFAMTEGGSWEIKMIERVSPHAGKFGQVILPSINKEPAITASDGWAFGITTSEPSKIDAASKLLGLLCSPEHQKKKLQVNGWLPVLKAGIPWVEEELGAEVALALRSYKPVPGGPAWPKTAMLLADALQQVLVGDAQPKDALREAQIRRGGEPK